MKVFISWSKEPSKSVARALRSWLPDVIQSLEPWMSDQDIPSGERWATTIGDKLAETNFGIIVLTPENQEAPWINFEAGAISKVIDESRVIPYTYGFGPADVVGPLSQFNGVKASKEGTLKMIIDINKNMDRPIENGRLMRFFENSWVN
ncbi:toll/interleukin-1 receptor domain-containing protein [Deinococcus sp.]|uniref:toll/interleukin-1 receptor domain-containing protein n=1 Tax=Deinococcus sp. TaxID=47478 RepID=UPI003CC62B82